MQVNGVANFLGLLPYIKEPKMTNHTKPIYLQISGDADAVNAAIAVLHACNFINGSIWSNAIRKRGERKIMRVATREIIVRSDQD